MKALCTSRYWELSSLFRGAFSKARTPLALSERFFLCQGKLAAYSSGNGSVKSIVVPPALLPTEKDEAMSVLTLFLKKQGLSKAVAARTINKSDHFIDHLISRLHSVYRSRYLVGGELTTLEIRETLVPYLECLLLQHGNNLRDLVENFPNAAVKEKPTTLDLQSHSTLDSKKPKAISLVSDTGKAGELHPQVLLYLMELGMDLERINVVIRRHPNFTFYSLENKIKPLVEFLLDLGVPKARIPGILSQRPQLCGLRLSENVIPCMRFLEGLGVDNKQWAKVVNRCPVLLCLSRQKVQAIVNFLYELGLSDKSIGKVLTQWPYVATYSVEDNLRPKVEYLRSLGVDVSILLSKAPHICGLNIECNLKAVIEFFLVRGFSSEEVRAMISTFPNLFGLSLAYNLIPKWEYFLTTGYSKFELVKFPLYFGYSLEHRIRPRYALVKQSRLTMSLNTLLSLSGCKFEKILKMKMEKMVSNKGSSGSDS